MQDDEAAIPFYLQPWFFIAALATPVVIGVLAFLVYNSSLLPLKDGDYTCLPEANANVADSSSAPILYGDDLAATVEDGQVTSVWSFKIDISNPDASRSESADFDDVEQTERDRFTVVAASPRAGATETYVCKHGGWD